MSLNALKTAVRRVWSKLNKFILPFAFVAVLSVISVIPAFADESIDPFFGDFTCVYKDGSTMTLNDIGNIDLDQYGGIVMPSARNFVLHSVTREFNHYGNGEEVLTVVFNYTCNESDDGLTSFSFCFNDISNATTLTNVKYESSRSIDESVPFTLNDNYTVDSHMKVVGIAVGPYGPRLDSKDITFENQKAYILYPLIYEAGETSTLTFTFTRVVAEERIPVNTSLRYILDWFFNLSCISIILDIYLGFVFFIIVVNFMR